MLLVKGQGGTLFACIALSFTIDFWEKTPLTNLVSGDYGCDLCLYGW